jgi:hypothetical protein
MSETTERAKPASPPSSASTAQPATPGKDPAPLGNHPSSDKLLDVASAYSFPASDPLAVGAAIHAAENEPPAADPGISKVPRHGDFPWPKAKDRPRG